MLFLLLLSGPPMFRSRSPLASLRDVVDPVVIYQLVVWGMAGIWVLVQFYHRRVRVNDGLLSRFWLPQKLGLALVLCLSCSVLVSPAPLLTAYKVYQMAVLLLFGFIFVQRYGVETCLRRLLLGYTILCIGAIILAFVAPHIVLTPSPVSAVARWRGDLYVPIATVTVFAIALLLTHPPAVSKPVFLVMLGLFSTLLVLAQTRTSYVAMLVLVVLAVLRQPKIAALRRFLWAIPAVVVLLLLTGFMPTVSHWVIRNPQTLHGLSGRTGLWTDVSDIALRKSPWIGLGYISAARILSLDYASNLGKAHSAFVEVFVGGGFVSLAVLTLLCCVLVVYILILLSRKNDGLSFAVSSLLPMVFVMAAAGWGGFDSGPLALTFWCLAAMLPLLRAQSRAGASRRVPA